MTPSASAAIVRADVDDRTVFAEVTIGSDEPVRWQPDIVAIHVWGNDDRVTGYRVYSDAARVLS